MDAWFAGFQRSVVAVVWIGYDNRANWETAKPACGLALPVWIDYMSQTLKAEPVEEPSAPEGLVQPGGRVVLRRVHTRQRNQQSRSGRQVAVAPTDEEKKGILDLFKALNPPVSLGATKRSFKSDCSLAHADKASKNSLPSRVSRQNPFMYL